MRHFLQGFKKLTLYKRSRRILEALKGERVTTDVFYNWKQQTAEARVNSRKIRDLAKSKKQRLFQAWESQAAMTKKIACFTHRREQDRQHRLRRKAWRALEIDLDMRHRCRKKLDGHLLKRTSQLKEAITERWLWYSLR